MLLLFQRIFTQIAADFFDEYFDVGADLAALSGARKRGQVRAYTLNKTR
jgi:hypothetical protein